MTARQPGDLDQRLVGLERRRSTRPRTSATSSVTVTGDVDEAGGDPGPEAGRAAGRARRPRR